MNGINSDALSATTSNAGLNGIVSSLASLPQALATNSQVDQQRIDDFRRSKLDPAIDSIFSASADMQSLQTSSLFDHYAEEKEYWAEHAKILARNRRQTNRERQQVCQAAPFDAVIAGIGCPRQTADLALKYEHLSHTARDRAKDRNNDLELSMLANSEFFSKRNTNLDILTSSHNKATDIRLQQLSKVTELIYIEIRARCELLTRQIDFVGNLYEKIVNLTTTVKSVEIEAAKQQHHRRIEELRATAEILLNNKQFDLHKWKAEVEHERRAQEHVDDMKVKTWRHDLDAKSQADDYRLRMLEAEMKPRGLLSWLLG